MFISVQRKFLHPFLLLLALSISAILSILISIALGNIHINILKLLRAFLNHSHNLQTVIVLKLRLPRTLCAFTTGGLLTLAGAFMQTLLKNPLSDPYILGISGGSAVAVLIALLFNLSPHALSAYAFLGGLLSMLVVSGLMPFYHLRSPLKLLLMGIIVAMGWNACISLILTVSPQENLRSMLFWLMGDLSYAQFSFWQLGVLGISIFVSLLLAPSMNVLCRGDLAARALGVNTRRLHWILYFFSALFTACAVSIAGCIGFVGLVIPHALRLLGLSDHRFMLPAAVLLGGSFLTVADTVARTALSPIQLPVGVVTAILGIPCFIILLKRKYWL